jgi:transcriptional regulator with XRE-family HTH domain
MPIPITPSMTIAVLRIIRHWSQAELAKAAGVRPSTISDLERGKKKPSPKMVARLASAMGYPPSQIDRTLAFVSSTLASLGDTAREPDLVTIAEEEGRRYADFILGSLGRVLSKVERRRAPELWVRLRRYPVAARRALIKETEEFRSWALCELLCHESERAAAHNADEALELAELALLVAELLPASVVEGLRLCAQGYSWAFVGNARRVKSDLSGAGEAFSCCISLWQAGAPAAEGFLDESRLLDLEASLRRDQRRLPEALDLLERAYALAGSDVAKGRILIKRARTLEEVGDYGGAVATLRQAGSLIDPAKDPRLYLCLRFNLLENLFQTGGLGEAATMLPEVRELAAHSELDALRLRWLEGRLAAGLGQWVEAERAFRQVRAGFTRRDIGYDVALVTLELAVLLVDQGRAGEVKELAREMASLFQAQGVHREALAALGLFCRAAETEAATAGLARQVLDYLRRARHDSELRFMPGAP